jgi:hypothetical protein
MRSARDELRPDRLPAPTAAEPDARPRQPPFGILLDDDDLEIKRIIQAKQRERAGGLEQLEQPEMVEKREHARRWTMAGPVLLSLLAVAPWAVGVRRVNLRQVSDLGLVSVLPVSVLIGLALATGAFVWTLAQRPPPRSALLLHVITLVLMLYGMTAMVEPVPGPNILWRHAGIADHIATTGTVDPTIDAYFNWPAFFALAAFLSSAAGLDSIIDLAARWVPVFSNLLYLGPLLLLYRRVTTDTRLVWLAVWFFYITNWIHQDYLAPQGLTYFLYLLIIAILLRWFSTDRSAWPAPARFLPWRPPTTSVILDALPVETPSPLARSTRRAGLMAVVIVLFAAAVPSHQLTPFAILAGVSALVIFGRCSARGLPFLMAVMLAAWITFLSAAYLAGHLSILGGHVGQVNSIAAANVTNRLTGSSDHQLIVQIRLALTARTTWQLRCWRSSRSCSWGSSHMAVSSCCACTSSRCRSSHSWPPACSCRSRRAQRRGARSARSGSPGSRCSAASCSPATAMSASTTSPRPSWPPCATCTRSRRLARCCWRPHRTFPGSSRTTRRTNTGSSPTCPIAAMATWSSPCSSSCASIGSRAPI